MSSNQGFSRAARLALLGVMLCALAGWFSAEKAAAQTAATGTATTVVNTGNIVNIVGGVRVDVNGVLNQQDERGRAEVLEARRRALQAVPGDINQPAKLRMVSLRKLDETIEECLKNGKVLPDEVKYLAGLQRVKYVFVYPDQKDVVIAGPAEGWKLNEAGIVVGNVSGHPVMQLDDLLVALRYADASRKNPMSVSIDPTPEGLQRLRDLTEKLTPNANRQAAIDAINQALGPQKISVNGVSASTRFANVMVAADYRMKCLGMGVDPSPVKGLQSYLQMGATAGGTLPRWWLAPKYDPLLTDGQGLAWELRGPGVMCMAEEDLFSPTGQREKTMKAGSIAQKWADAMTNHYEELSQKEAVFGDLRNCMDLAVVGALIVKEHLLDKADLRPKNLTSEQQLPTAMYNSPKQVDTKSSFVRRTVISGGVQLQPWEVIQKQETSEAVSPIRSSASAAKPDRWWWN
jgi:hypothetical protein